MPRGTVEERRAHVRARRLRLSGAVFLILFALTHRPYSASLKSMNLARNVPPDMTLIPNALLGAGTATLLVAALMSLMLLYVTRRGNPQALMDQIALVRLGSWAIAVGGVIGFVALFVGGLIHGWS